jgi:Lipocalin-like domain
MRIIWLVAGVACFTAFFRMGTVHAGDDLIGTWRLVSASGSTDKGDVIKEAYGPNPTGILTFTADGRMMAIIAMSGRKLLSVPDRISAPAEERADAFSTFIAYAGRYSFDGKKEIIHIDVSSLQNWVGTDQVRFVSLHGDRVTLSTPPMPRGGVLQTFELVWERLK